MADLAHPQGSGHRSEKPVSLRSTELLARRGEALDLSRLLARSRSPQLSVAGDPELEHLTFGILPLTDCAPIVIAHERKLFERSGITSSVAKFGSWTASRDGLLSGRAHAAQMLFGMPVAAAVGKPELTAFFRQNFDLYCFAPDGSERVAGAEAALDAKVGAEKRATDDLMRKWFFGVKPNRWQTTN